VVLLRWRLLLKGLLFGVLLLLLLLLLLPRRKRLRISKRL
jgi:hypothetical protein